MRRAASPARRQTPISPLARRRRPRPKGFRPKGERERGTNDSEVVTIQPSSPLPRRLRRQRRSRWGQGEAEQLPCILMELCQPAYGSVGLRYGPGRFVGQLLAVVPRQLWDTPLACFLWTIFPINGILMRVSRIAYRVSHISYPFFRANWKGL